MKGDAMSGSSSCIGRLTLGAALGAALLCTTPAAAQVAVIVNGDPITVYDIEQRGRLMRLTGDRNVGRQQIVEELINDRLKLSDAKRYKLEVGDKEVDNAFASLARNARTTPENFARSLSGQGVDPNTLKARLRADIAWGQIIRGKFQSSLQINEKELFNALETRNPEGKDVGYEYTLVPILFVATRGASQSVIEERKREAELLRTRFQNCETGIPFARALRDVAVRDTIRRNSADLSPQLRAILDRVEIGRLTAPEVTPGGVEVFALCNRKETTADTPAKRALREQIFSERFKTHAERYLKELRKAAMIEFRE
ncbi:MAG: Chaperone SurA [Pseudorhodoplanes sp.]|nr:Chaperone SurA [Pseudorhodoplanes sp.]